MSIEEEVIQTVSKFQLIRGYPPAAPSKCVSCGAFSGDFIDFGFDIDYYGAVYFCRSCFTEGCYLFGYHSDEKMKLLAKELGESNSEVLRLTIENEALKNALAATDLVSGVIDSIKSNNLPAVENVQSERTDPPSDDQQASGDAKPISKRDKRSSKQSDEQGSTGVPDDDSSLTDAGLDI